MENKTKVINVPVTKEVHQALKILCIRRGLTQAQLVGQLIDQAEQAARAAARGKE